MSEYEALNSKTQTLLECKITLLLLNYYGIDHCTLTEILNMHAFASSMLHKKFFIRKSTAIVHCTHAHCI